MILGGYWEKSDQSQRQVIVGSTILGKIKGGLTYLTVAARCTEKGSKLCKKGGCSLFVIPLRRAAAPRMRLSTALRVAAV